MSDSDLKKVIHTIRDATLSHSDIHQLLEMLHNLDWWYTAHIGGLESTGDIQPDEKVAVKVLDVMRAWFPLTFAPDESADDDTTT